MSGTKFQFTGPTTQYSGTMSFYLGAAYADTPAGYRGIVGIYNVATRQRVAVSAETTGLAVGWNAVTLIGNFQLVNGSWYWLVIQTPYPDFSVAIRMSDYNSPIADQSMSVSPAVKTYDGTLPATLPTFAGRTSARIASIYASLATSGTSPPPSTDQTTPPPTTTAITPPPSTSATTLPRSSNNNLADIPDDWELTYGAGPQIISLDYSTVHTSGHPSIAIAPHTSADVNTAREANCYGPNLAGLQVKPGDHIVFSCWIRTGLSSVNSAYNSDPTDSLGKGARIGIDFYTPSSHSGIGALVNGVGNNANHISGWLQNAGSHVPWNTQTWTQQRIDCIVPNGYNIAFMIPWIQIELPNDAGKGWFADAELYINPL
ncbi:hypothetical protein MUP77_07105 [Candidatus Bathyarchaeota archaeon]|nr:hypothetical protein [Candidatus Bathyarchaeota archaeon]